MTRKKNGICGAVCCSVTLSICTAITTQAVRADDANSALLQIEVAGQVANPGSHTLPPAARLFDATRKAKVRADTYLLGAAWLHAPAKAEQKALKAGLLFELSDLQQQAQRKQQSERAGLLQRLHDQVAAMPVTGRVPENLDPIRLEIGRRHNRLLADGDKLLYPLRPDTVIVSGAVANECILPFVGLKTATEYLKDCAPHADADSDWLYVIQPDGKHDRYGIAAWNKDAAQPLAPGARLLVPLRTTHDSEMQNDSSPRRRPGSSSLNFLDSGLRRSDDSSIAQHASNENAVNEDLATFFATQPLPTGGSR